MAAKRKYTEDMLREAVAASSSIAGGFRYLGQRQAGGTQAHLGRLIKRWEIDTSHFRPFARQGSQNPNPRLPPPRYLVHRDPLANRLKSPILKRSLREIGRPYICEMCGNDGSWFGCELTLHVDHIDGNHSNNVPENLRFLCPNCHSQPPTYAGRSTGKSGHRAQGS